MNGKIKLRLISTSDPCPSGETPGTRSGMETWALSVAAFADYLAAGGRTYRTITLRRYWLGRVAATFPDRSPWSIGPLELTAWLAQDEWAPETRRSIRSALRTFYAWAVDLGIAGSSPAKALPPVKIPRRIPRPTPDEVTARALEKANPRDRLMLRLAVHAGLRREEIAALRWSALADRWLTVRGKGGRERRIPIPEDLAQELALERARRAGGEVGPGWRFRVDPHSPFVFPGLRSGHMHVDTVGSTLSDLLGGYGGHTLRHRYATRTLRGSKNLRATQELLGHASILTTQAYTLVVDDDLIEAARWAA